MKNKVNKVTTKELQERFKKKFDGGFGDKEVLIILALTAFLDEKGLIEYGK